MLLADIAAGQALEGDPRLVQVLPLFADVLALLRREALQEVVKACIAGIFEMKLDVGAPKPRAFADRIEIRFGEKGDMHRRAAINLALIDQRTSESEADL